MSFEGKSKRLLLNSYISELEISLPDIEKYCAMFCAASESIFKVTTRVEAFAGPEPENAAVI